MKNKNKLIELLEYEVRWYYRTPILIAILGVFLSIVAFFYSNSFLLTIGGSLFFIGLGAQWVLGFDDFFWNRKRK
ncbi:hypothetical protein PXU57_005225 [Salmonella enterica subsp. enterica]|nr:hypothetical protein [Salmonella enterica subsp. enterica]